METFNKRPQPPQSLTSQTAGQNPPATPDPSGVLDAAAEAQGLTEVIHGAHQERYDLAGKTVGYVRQALGDVFNIPRDAECLVDGRPVLDSEVVKANSVVEFIRPSGTKGCHKSL